MFKNEFISSKNSKNFQLLEGGGQFSPDQWPSASGIFALRHPVASGGWVLRPIPLLEMFTSVHLPPRNS